MSLGTKKDALRIAVFTDSAEHAGAEQYLVTLLGGIQGQAEVTTFLGEEVAFETERRLAPYSRHVRRIKGATRRPSPLACLRLARALRAAAVDVLLINFTDQGGALAGLFAAAVTRTPTVGMLNLWRPGRTRLRDRLSSALLRVPRVLIVPSETAGHRPRECGLQVTVIPYGIPRPDSLSREAARTALGCSQSATIVGGVGRLHPQKGWDVLIEAAGILQAVDPTMEFVVIGEGTERSRLEARSGTGLVRFPGYWEDAARFIPAFDVLVMPSRYESFGMVAMEAAWSGVPVVAADAGGLGDVVSGVGRLIPVDDPEALAGAVLHVLGHPDESAALGDAARRRVEERYSVERHVDQTLEILRKAAGGGSITEGPRKNSQRRNEPAPG